MTSTTPRPSHIGFSPSSAPGTSTFHIMSTQTAKLTRARTPVFPAKSTSSIAKSAASSSSAGTR